MSDARYDVLEDLEDLAAELEVATQTVNRLQARRVDLVKQAHNDRHTLREIAAATGLSHQRVSQLVNGS